MKKKTQLLLVLMLTCVLVLSGCACEHEWTEADCLNASVCTKCEEVQGEALGHDWQAATCEAPETCSRCGETQGEALEHTYGKWELFGEEMSHACDVCGSLETVAADREVFLMQQLEGHWDFYAEEGSGYSMMASQLRNDIQGLSLHVDPENGSWVRNPLGSPEIYPVTPIYEDFKQEENVGYYYFQLDFVDSDSAMYMTYIDINDQVAFSNGEAITILSRNDELAQFMTGLWASVKGADVYTLDLKEDRTFCANVADKEINGTWHLRNIAYYQTSRDENAPIYSNCTLDLVYEEDGKAVVRSHNLDLGQKDTPLKESSLAYNGFSLKLTDDYINLGKMDAEALELLKQANAEGEQQILGKWESTTVRVYTYDTGSSTETENTDYSITFNEDGTFTASLDQERAGTWKFDRADITSGSGDSIYYSYKLKFDGVSQEIHTSIGYERELYLSDSDGSSSRQVYFAQMTEEEKAALAAARAEASKLLLGEWTSLSVSTYDNNTSSRNETTDTGNTFTFHEDGTFTTNLEAVPAGTWSAGDVDIQTYDGGFTTTNYFYNLQVEGFEGSVSASIYDSGNGLDLNFNVYKDGISTNYSCGQYTAEDMAKIAEAPSLIVGTWKGTEFFTWNEETEQQESVRKEAHTLNIKGNGTFTSTLPQLAEGQWSFWKLDQYGMGYSFHVGDSGYIYRITDEGTLDIWISENDRTLSMTMTKE